MAAGIAAKSGAEARREALELECADLERRIAERDEELAWMTARAAELEAAQVAKSAASENASARVEAFTPPPDPAAEAWSRQDVELHAMALFAKEPGGPEKGSRGFWRRQLNALGAHLLPSGSPDDQLRAALRDPRGADLLVALQSCPT